MQEMEETRFGFGTFWSKQLFQMTLMDLVGGLPLYIA